MANKQKDAGLEKTLIKIMYPNHGGEIPDWGDVQSHELNDILKLFEQAATQVRQQAFQESLEALQEQRVTTPSGKCPSQPCNSDSHTLGFHPVDVDEHYQFYNRGINDGIVKIRANIEKLKKEKYGK